MSQAADASTGGQQDLKQAATQVGENLRAVGTQVRDQATEYYEQGRQRAMEMEQTLEQYVHDKPIQSLMIAAGVGMLLGMLWKRS